MSRLASLTSLSCGALLVALAGGAGVACNACGKSGSPLGAGEPNLSPGTASVLVNRTSVPPDGGPTAMRDVAMWANARDGHVEDLASLATHEGAVGLIEAAAQPELRVTAIRAMGYARGWAQLPFLAAVAAGENDAEAKAALESVGELAARRRRSEDVEDADELRDACEKLGALARDAARARERRVTAIGALRMMPCPKQELPTDLDAR